jgi:hypothetical protein
MKFILRIATPLAFVAIAAFAQTSKQNEMHDRGQTPIQSGPAPLVTLGGILVDAGCSDRTGLNLSQTPESMASMAPAQTAAETQASAAMRAQQGYANPGGKQEAPAITAQGVTVDAKTLQAERADVLEHQVADLHSRQIDPTCAVTGATHSFAILLGTGRFLNLDDGGNTLATEAVQGSATGRALLNGTGPGFKPQATIKGHIRADKVVVDSIKLK